MDNIVDFVAIGGAYPFHVMTAMDILVVLALLVVIGIGSPDGDDADDE